MIVGWDPDLQIKMSASGRTSSRPPFHMRWERLTCWTDDSSSEQHAKGFVLSR